MTTTTSPKKSKLVLGTVQLGMNYGAPSSAAQPTRAEALAILDKAYSEGINTFDTANAYGEAESILGEWIESRKLSESVYIVSKLKPHVLRENPHEAPEGIVEREIAESLKRLRLTSIDGFLLHTPEYLYRAEILDGLKNAQRQGLVNHIGVSVYEMKDALKAVDLGLDYIQVPYNALDQRIDRVNLCAKAKDKGLIVFARSPFLQGLLLMEPEKLPPHLEYASERVEQFKKIAAGFRLSALEASLIFAFIHSPANHLVFGVERLSQLNEDVAIAARAAAGEFDDLIGEITENFCDDVDNVVVDPRVWGKAQ